MDADDEAVLNLIAECEWDLSNPPGNMSSSQKEHDADLHYAQGAHHSTVKAQGSDRPWLEHTFMMLTVLNLNTSISALELQRGKLMDLSCLVIIVVV